MDRLADLGADVVTVDPVFDEDPVRPWLILAMAGNARAIEHLRDTPAFELLDRDHVAMIDAFGMVPGTAVLAANDACHEANLRLVELFHRVPLLCTPTVAGQTGPVGEQGTIAGQPDHGWVSERKSTRLKSRQQ